ncbi:hypothetical protein ACOMHN_053900 [Nucella lapillus]
MSWSLESELGRNDFSSPEEELLYYSRNGYDADLQSLLQHCADKNISVDVNCKGHKKSNRGWTPLHLAAYFGHAAVARILLEAGAVVNVINSAGDTPLHRAAYTGREDIVSLLLEFGADIAIVNAEGHRARNVTRQEHVIKMLEAAASHEARLLNDQLLTAAATGNMELLESVISNKNAPSLQHTDEFGNTALHHAAMRANAQVAVCLLQNGVDPHLTNVKGQTASDVASSPQMRQVLGVQPIKTLRLHPQRFEGPLSKKSRFVGFKSVWVKLRFVGFKSVWVVLERGVLSYFHTRGDASTGSKRKGMKYLDEARLWVSEASPLEIKIFFSDGVVHTVSLEPSPDAHLHRQKWVNALNEHIAYSTHYTHQGEKLKDEEEEELMPLGTMQDSLQTAQAHQKILEKQIQMMKNTAYIYIYMSECTAQAHQKILEKQIQMLKNTVDTLEHFILRLPAQHHPPPVHNSAYVHTQEHEYLASIHLQASDLLKSSRDMCSSLTHCMMLFSQQEEVRQVQLQEQTEKCRVLQESLHALATEHHDLERSLHRRPSMRSLREEDDFYDCDDDSYGD